MFYRINEARPGDIVPEPTENINLYVRVSDADTADVITRIELFRDGKVIATDEPNRQARCWETTLTAQGGAHYYFVKVTQRDGNLLWSAPIWFGAASATGPSLALIRRDAIAKIEGLGGRVSHEESESGNVVRRVSVSGGERFDDAAMEYLSVFPELESLHLHRPTITDEGMRHLAHLRNLKSLSISHADITDEGAAVISRLASLQNLDLGNTWISDEGLSQLLTLKDLEHLSLAGTQITDSGIACLKQFPRLKRVGLGLRGKVTDEGLRHLADMPALETLQFSTDFTDAGLIHVGALSSLENLSILNCSGVTDDGVNLLREMTNLTSLSFVGLNLSDTSMKTIGTFRELRRLHLEAEGISDAGFAELARLSKLESLTLWGLDITDEGLEALAELPRLNELLMARIAITDAGLAKLKGIKTLTRLSILSCDVSGAGVDDLKKALPGLRVFHR